MHGATRGETRGGVNFDAAADRSTQDTNRRRISGTQHAARPLRMAGALAAVAMVTLTFGAMVVLPARLDAHDATLTAKRTVVEVIGPTRLDRATRTARRADGIATAAPGAFAALDRMLDRVAARSGRTRTGGESSGSLD